MPHPDIDDAILTAVDRLRARCTPHEIARMLRQVAQRLDDEPMVMAPGAEAFIENEVVPRIPGGRNAAVVDAFLTRPDAALRPYRNARHALAAGDFDAVRDFIDALSTGGGA